VFKNVTQRLFYGIITGTFMFAALYLGDMYVNLYLDGHFFISGFFFILFMLFVGAVVAQIYFMLFRRSVRRRIAQ